MNWEIFKDIDSDRVLETIIATVLGAIIATILMKLVSLLRRPRLDIVFDKDDTFDELKMENIDTKPLGLFIHLSIKNKRSSMARDCMVSLLRIDYKDNCKFRPIKAIKPHLVLKWANERVEKGFNGLEIPGYFRRRVDFIHAPKGNEVFFLFIEGSPRGVPNGFVNGEYRFTLQVAGENTNTVTKRFIIRWRGKFYRDNVEIKECFFYNKFGKLLRAITRRV